MTSSKIYTRTGDEGKTSLIGGTRVSKAHLRLETYGTVDELNSVIGVVIASMASPSGTVVSAGTSSGSSGSSSKIASSNLQAFLQRLQSDLFDIGSHLACEDLSLRAKLPLIHEEHISELESAMDEMSLALPALKNFILPGGSLAAAHAHVARTVCRRAERLCVALSESIEASTESDDSAPTISAGSASLPSVGVDPRIIRYLNRLSDYLFVLARSLNFEAHADEVVWAPRKS